MQTQDSYIAPVWSPPPPGVGATESTDFQLNMGGLKHVDDPSGENRRYFEGWASLAGIDMQDMELTADCCQAGAEKYLRRNPVIVWHHQPHMPIGKVLSLTFTPEGMWMSGYIFRMDDVLDKWRRLGKKIPLDSIAMKCEEVWKGIKSEAFKGLSVRGGVRQMEGAFSPQLQKEIPRVTEVEMYEISVTPISIHPGTQIKSINTIAKALEVSKALPCVQPNTKEVPRMSAQERIANTWNEFIGTVNEAAGDKDTVEIPEEVAKGLASFSSAVSEQQQAPMTPEQVQAMVNRMWEEKKEQEVQKGLQEENARLREEVESLRGGNAPRRSHVSVSTPEGSQVKPGEVPDGPGSIEKALDNCANAMNGRLDLGDGALNPVTSDMAWKLALLDAASQGHMNPFEVSLTKDEQRRWKQCIQ